MSKGLELIPSIIGATTKKEAIKVLHEVLEALHLTSDYTAMVALRDELDEYKRLYRSTTEKYEKSDRGVDAMIAARTDLNFLYRDVTDKFSFEINKLKILWEESKTTTRGTALKNLKENEEIKAEFKANSTSALKDLLGLDSQYISYISCYSMSYGMYKELDALLTSIKMFVELIASELSREKVIMMKDVK